jgi:hypothetical protein
MLIRLAFAMAVLAAGQMVPNAASACLIFPEGKIAILDRELPKTTLTATQRAEAQRLRTRALALIDEKKQLEAYRVAESALAAIGYTPPGPPSRC